MYEQKFDWWLSQCMNRNLTGDWVNVWTEIWLVTESVYERKFDWWLSQCMNRNLTGDWVNVWTEIWLVTESRHEQKFERWLSQCMNRNLTGDWLSQCMLNGEGSVYEQKFEWWLVSVWTEIWMLTGSVYEQKFDWWLSQCMNRNLTGDWVSVWTEIWLVTESVYEQKFDWWLSQCMNRNLTGDWVKAWTEIWMVTESVYEQKFDWWLTESMYVEWWRVSVWTEIWMVTSQCMNRNLTGDWVKVWTETWMVTESVYVEWWRVSVWTEIWMVTKSVSACWLVTESVYEQKYEWWLSQCTLNDEEWVCEQKFADSKLYLFLAICTSLSTSGWTCIVIFGGSLDDFSVPLTWFCLLVNQSISQSVRQSTSQPASLPQSANQSPWRLYLIILFTHSLALICILMNQSTIHPCSFFKIQSCHHLFVHVIVSSFISSFTQIHFFNLIHFWLHSFLHLFCASFSTDHTEGHRRIPSVSPALWCNTRVSLPLRRGCDNSSLLPAALETPRETAHAAGGSCPSMPGTPSRTPSHWLCRCTSGLCPHNTPLWKRKL